MTTTTPAQSGEHGNQGPAITQGVTGTTGVETGTVLEGIRHKVFLDRYARKGEDGTPLEQYPEQMWRRVAAGIAEVEPTPEKRAEWTEKFAGLLSDFKFVPGGRILSGAGTGHQVTYYNCYVVGLGEDPLDPAAPRRPQLSPAAARPAFFNALTQMTDIMSRSGGVGMNLSSLPPRGTAIAEAGRGRAGAVRPTVALDLRHPDVVRLLDEKDGPNLAHLDVAVIVPPVFDQALADDADWTLQWEDRRGDTLKARDLWARVTSDASAEAGRSVGILRPDVETLRIADSRDAIVAGAAEVAARLYRGEGVIVDFSPLRPKGAYIKTVNGTSSGPVAWMYLIDAVAQLDDGASAGEKGVIWFGEIASTITGKTIQQGGSRRGALMLMLDDDHPDIEEFIKAKRIDPATNRPVMIEHANMSVCASDAFMAAVKADLPWDLKWQGKVVRTVRARHLWDLICTAAWTTAEPGLVFMERYQKRSNTYYFENIRCVNPCVAGDTLVYTAGGLYPAAELAETGAPITVTSSGEDGVSFKQASHVFPTGVKPVYRLQTKEGYTVRLTADHKVLTTRGWKEARDLTVADKIKLLNGEGGFGVSGNEDMGRVLGWLVGDGHITNRGKGQAAVILSFWGEDRTLAESFREYITRAVGALEPRNGRAYDIGIVDVDGRDESRIRSIRLMRLIDPELIHNKLQVPPSVLRGSRSMQKGFLQAIFSADGTVNISGHVHAPTISIRLASSTRDLLTQIQQLLLNFGIACRLYKRRDAGSKALPDGKGGAMSYATAAQYELILGKENFVAFVREIGFLRESKQRKAEDVLRQHPGDRRHEYFTATFESLTPDGEETVYDLTEPESHLFIGNGLLLHNCGEQGLPPGGVCNLGALNLERYVDANGALLEDDLARDAAYATRFLDNVIDATPYFSELHVAMQREGTRRTGLGTMGLADALIKMEVAYGSAESEEAIDRIYRVIRDSSYRASVELAREKGAFGKFDRDKYLQGWFIRRLPEDVRDGIAEHGIRNGVLLTQAPTGTTSLLAGVSSGIEPVFDFAMKRVDRTGEHILYHPLYEAWRAAHPGEERPDFFVGAKDLTPEEHVVVQAKVQQYTDSSISKTANAPHDHTMEEVKRLYIQAYDLGCKGVTYYRDGSRDAVLTSVSEAPRKAAVSDKTPDDGAVAPAVAPSALEAAAQPIGPTPAATETASVAPELVASPTAPAGPDLPSWLLDGTLKRRPAEMSGFTRNVSAPEGKVNITINSDADGPLELFINVGRAGSDVAALAEALGRLVSLQLRLPSTMSQEERLRQAANQLKGIGGSRSIGFGVNRVLSLPDAVAQAIYRHLEEHPAPPHKAADVPAAQLALPVAETSVAAPLAHPAPAPHAPAIASAHVGNGNGNGHANGHANGNGAGTQLPLGAAMPVAVASPVAVLTGNLCPQCGSSGAYVFEEGCKKCHYCGYSEC